MSKENSVIREAFISQKESVILQGVAAFLMVWHHLFGFPERVNVPYILVFDSLFHIETVGAYFGQICIAVFAFLSGYGMEKKAISSGNIGIKSIGENYRSAIKHLLKFYSRYWMVFITFVPIGFILNKYPIRIEAILKSFLGQSYVYNAEWWYIGDYIKFLLLFPLFSALAEWLRNKSPILLHTGMLLGITVLVFVSQELTGDGFYSVLICFIEGMYFARTILFERGNMFLNKNWLCLLIGVVLILAVFVLRTLGTSEYLLVPFWVFGLSLLLKNRFLMKYVGLFFGVIGKYSTYVWLTHTFFAYYYFQSFTYAPKYSWLIAIWCIGLCITTGMVLEKIRMVLGAKKCSNKLV